MTYQAEYAPVFKGWVVRDPYGMFVCQTRTETWPKGNRDIGRADALKIAQCLNEGRKGCF